MSQERIHYWSAHDRVFHAAVLAAAQAGVTVAEWVGQAVEERLRREGHPPGKVAVGTLWLESDTGQMKRWTGSEWEPTTD